MTDATVISSDDGQGADQYRKKAEAAYEQYLAGDDAAYDTVNAYLEPVAKIIVKKFLFTPEEQEDVILLSLNKIVKQKGRRPGERGRWNRGGGAGLKTWFNTLVDNAAKDLLRKKTKSERFGLSDDATDEEILERLRSKRFCWAGNDAFLLQTLTYHRGSKNNQGKSLADVKLPVYDALSNLRKGPVGEAGNEDGSSAGVDYVEDKEADSDPVANAMREEDAGRVNAAIQQLNDNERQVITMHFFGHMKQTDIAEKLGMCDAWVTKVKKSALNRLSELLDDVDPSAGDT
jgi:RNA polymerase sigma factor (sigma-70 family)